MQSEWEQFPTCPACGFVDQDWWDGMDRNSLEHDGDTDEWSCPKCDRNLKVTMCVEYTFRVELDDD